MGGRKKPFKRDPCPLCNSSEHGPYKCPYQSQAIAIIAQHRSTNTLSTHTAYFTQYNGSGGATSEWISNLVATHHFSPHLTDLTNIDQTHGSICLEDGSKQPIYNIVSDKITSNSSIFHLNNLLHTSSIPKSLIWVHKFAFDNHCYFVFYPSNFFVKDWVNHQVKLQGTHDGGVFIVCHHNLCHK